MSEVASSSIDWQADVFTSLTKIKYNNNKDGSSSYHNTNSIQTLAHI